MPNAPLKKIATPEQATVAGIVARARVAMQAFDSDNQRSVDEATTALAWSVYKPENAKILAELAVSETGLGNVNSKIVKNTRKTFGTLRDLMRARTVGVISEDREKGIVCFGKPVGVVGAVCPSTNPAATPVNKAMMAIKGGNAVVIAPSPAGYWTTAAAVELMRGELAKSRHPVDLVQVLPAPVNKEMTQQLLEQVDLAVVTGSQDNVKRAMRSGTVTIGVGAGNVPVIIDSTADLHDAARKIRDSKIFDNATSCSSENALVVLQDVYDDAMAALTGVGGYRCDVAEIQRIRERLWVDGKLNRAVIAKDAGTAADIFALAAPSKSARFFLVEQKDVEGKGSFADEKLSLVLTVYKAKDFRHAVDLVRRILSVTGRGHSTGIHTKDLGHARELAEVIDVGRVLVNQAHTFGNGGSFTNGLPFTLSMGGGTWAGNTIDGNLNYRCFINVTRLVSEIPEDKPADADLFGAYWSKFGK
jgi:sulfoacetaldehyde dehydrogenase